MHLGGAKAFKPDIGMERARMAWLGAIDLAEEANSVGFLKVYDMPGKVGRGSSNKVTTARRLALYLATTVADVGSRELAKAAGVHRSTIGHHLQAVEDLRDDPMFDRMVDELGQRLVLRCAAVVTASMGYELRRAGEAAA